MFVEVDRRPGAVAPLLGSIARHGGLADIAPGEVAAAPLAERVARYRRWLQRRYPGTDVMPHVAASLFLKVYASRLLTPVVVGFVLERAVPDVSRPGAHLTERDLCPAGVRLAEPRVATGDDAALMRQVQHWALAGHLTHVVDHLRHTMRAAGCTVAPRMLWENVAASAIYTFTVTGAAPDHRARSDSLMTDVLLAIPRYGARLLGEVQTHVVDGRRLLLATRHTCCLKNRLPGRPTCLECPRLTAPERAAALADRVRADDLMPGLPLSR